MSTEKAVPDIETDFYPREFCVYNPSGSVGVCCDGRGQVSALMLDDDALEFGDLDLGREIVFLGQLARAKYRMELRLWSLASVAAQGRDPDRMDRFYRRVQKLLTPQEYRELEAAEFARRYAV